MLDFLVTTCVSSRPAAVVVEEEEEAARLQWKSGTEEEAKEEGRAVQPTALMIPQRQAGGWSHAIDDGEKEKKE